MKKQNEELHAIVLKLHECIMALELKKDDVKLYERRVCVRIEDVPVESEERADNVYEKVGHLLKTAHADVHVSCTDRAYHVSWNKNHTKRKRNVVV